MDEKTFYKLVNINRQFIISNNQRGAITIQLKGKKHKINFISEESAYAYKPIDIVDSNLKKGIKESLKKYNQETQRIIIFQDYKSNGCHVVICDI